MEEQEAHNCPLMDNCRLIWENKDRMPELIFRLKESYCRKEYSQCTRKWLADRIGLEAVPALMMPNQWEWARQIVEDHQVAAQEQEESASSK